ncbi:MAG: hypothetical protein R2748_23075 [Bryobacterales bacterium]
MKTHQIEPDPTADARTATVVDGLYPDKPEPLRVLSVEKLFEMEQIRVLLEEAAA